MNKFKVGDKVKLISNGSSVGSFDLKDGNDYYGARVGETKIILGVVPFGGMATEEDPRYYGENFNVRGCDLELVEEAEGVKNNYPIF